MSVMIFIECRVDDFDAWKKSFDQGAPARAEAGFEHTTVYRDTRDPAVVWVTSRVRDERSARRYYASPVVLEAISSSGMVGAPKLHCVQEVASHDYGATEGHGPSSRG